MRFVSVPGPCPQSLFAWTQLHDALPAFTGRVN
jgi:hypothetical protein